jgi:hypothetical protein
MAETITLANFNFDTTRLEKSLDSLQDKFFDLKKAQKEYADEGKNTQREIDVLVKKNELLSKSAGNQTEAMAKNQAEITALTAKQRDLAKSEQTLGVQMGTTRKEITQTTNQLKTYQDAENKTTSLIDLGNAAMQRQINNKNDARAANIALNNIVNQLNPNIDAEKKAIVDLNAQMDKNTAFIKDNSSETAKQKMNIGNYTESIKEALGEINPFNQGIGGFITQSEKAGGAGNLLGGAFNTIKVGILGALKAGLAFIATPIGAVIAALAVAVGAVVGAFKLATASLNSTEEGTQKLAVVTGAITGIFKGLFQVVKPLGLFFADVFIKTFENVGKVAEKALGLLSAGLKLIGADSAAAGVDKFTTSVKNSSKASADLALAEGRLAVKQREATKIQLDYQKQAEKLRQQRDDETNSVAQRIAINEKLGKVLQQQSAAELSIANQALNVSNLRIKADGKTTEALEQNAEARTRISDIQERISGQESEQLSNLNSLRRDGAAQQKAISDANIAQRQKEVDNLLEKSKQEIDLFISQQGFKKKSSQEEYEFNKTLQSKELADLKLQFDKKKISQSQYETEKNNITNEFAKKNVDLLIENAQLEVDAETEKNARILENSQFLSDEQLRIKKEALANQLIADNEFALLQLENGVINQQAYDLAIATSKEESRLANEELETERLAAQQEADLIDIENKKIIAAEDFIAQMELEKQQLDIKQAQEIASAEDNGAQIALINEKYAQFNKDIDNKVLDAKLSATASTFGDIANLLGENSKAGKAAAIAQATINTYQGVSAAFMAPSVLPQPFDGISKALAAGVALASGLKAVKQITATKSPGIKKPSYASGVIGLRGIGSGTSDNISANLSAGESVINARSTAMFASQLSAINQAGGGVGLNGASNIGIQNDIQSRSDSSQMAETIANAVRAGAEAGTSSGSQKGLVSLSDNRKVMADAKF